MRSLGNNQIKPYNTLLKSYIKMELNYMNTLPLGGFNYDNCLRNKALEANLPADKQLKYTKTGTTICGVVFAVSDIELIK